MAVVDKFEGRRSRGIVWVCDIASSSKYLNDNESVTALETFLQRFLFLSLIFVEASGGVFVKWTGDGFLAWFETPLLRNAGSIASAVFNAAWTLTFYVNVSQLCVKAPVKFKIRHAVTFEHDALVLDLGYSQKSATDVLGRAVVLAFRLSSITAEFPSIVTQGELLKATKDTGTISFGKLKFSKEEKLKYFKDERWGTSDVYSSKKGKHRLRDSKALLKRTKKLINEVEGKPFKSDHEAFIDKIVSELSDGPAWCRDVQIAMNQFTREDLLGNLKKMVPILEGVGGAKKRHSSSGSFANTESQLGRLKDQKPPLGKAGRSF
jgi:class 3 adenylate cyclase